MRHIDHGERILPGDLCLHDGLVRLIYADVTYPPHAEWHDLHDVSLTVHPRRVLAQRWPYGEHGGPTWRP